MVVVREEVEEEEQDVTYQRKRVARCVTDS